MIGTIEIFDLVDFGQLIYSSGNAPKTKPQFAHEAHDYIVVRRYGPKFVPRAQICTFILDEFLLWHESNFPWHEAFSEISARDHHFISGLDIITLASGDI